MVKHPPHLIANHAAALLKYFAGHGSEYSWSLQDPPPPLDIQLVTKAAQLLLHGGPKVLALACSLLCFPSNSKYQKQEGCSVSKAPSA